MSFLRNFLKYIKRLFSSTFIFLAIFLSLQWYILEPYVDTKYIQIETMHYENNIWIYIAYVFATISILCMLYVSIVDRSVKEAFGCAGAFVLLFLLLLGMLKHPVEKANLAVNTWFTSETFQKNYIISKRQDSTIYLRAEPENIFDGISHTDNIHTIEKFRKEKNLPSLYNLKNGDTIRVTFAKGYLDIKYLK